MLLPFLFFVPIKDRQEKQKSGNKEKKWLTLVDYLLPSFFIKAGKLDTNTIEHISKTIVLCVALFSYPLRAQPHTSWFSQERFVILYIYLHALSPFTPI